MTSPFTDILYKYAIGLEESRIGSSIEQFADDKYVIEADQAIKAAIAEAIGEDEPVLDTIDPDSDVGYAAIGGRNQLRAEIRAKLGIEENKT